MSRLPRLGPRRLARAAGVLAIAVAALSLAPVDDDTAGYAVSRVPSGLAVAADPDPNTVAVTPAAEPVDGDPGPSAPARDAATPNTTPPDVRPVRLPAPAPGPADVAPPSDSSLEDPCLPPPAGAVPPEAASAQVGAPPKPGTYEYLVELAGEDPARPRTDRWVITAPGTDNWDLTVPYDPGWSATSTLALQDDAIELTAWTLRRANTTITARPLTPVPDLVLPASAGTAWDETSYDLSARVSVRSTGRYLQRQAVPLCGALVDAWKVETTLAITPLPTAGPDAPTVLIHATRWVATQRGALTARATQRVEATVAGAELTVDGTWYLRELDPA